MGGGSDEDTHDAYLEQMKAEGAERDDDSESSEGLLQPRSQGLLRFQDGGWARRRPWYTLRNTPRIVEYFVT